MVPECLWGIQTQVNLRTCKLITRTLHIILYFTGSQRRFFTTRVMWFSCMVSVKISAAEFQTNWSFFISAMWDRQNADMELHYRVLEWAQPCKLVSARADTMGFLYILKQKERKLSVTNSVWILKYTTASIIACCYIIKSHQSNMLNQYLLDLEPIKIGGLY